MQYTHPPVELGTLDDGTPILGLRDTDAAGTPYVVTTADGPGYHFTLDEAGWIGFSVGTLDAGDGAALSDALRLRELLTGDNLERLVAAANSHLGASLEIPGYSDKTPPSYQRGLNLLEAAVLLLGQKAPRILTSVTDVLTLAQPLPAPAPVEHEQPWFPEPEGFQHEVGLGDFDGEPLEGLLMWQEEIGRAKPYAVRTTIGGVEICILPALDADDTATLNINRGAGQACMGDIDLADFGALIELHQGGQLPRLIELARRFVAEPAEQRRAA